MAPRLPSVRLPRPLVSAHNNGSLLCCTVLPASHRPRPGTMAEQSPIKQCGGSRCPVTIKDIATSEERRAAPTAQGATLRKSRSTTSSHQAKTHSGPVGESGRCWDLQRYAQGWLTERRLRWQPGWVQTDNATVGNTVTGLLQSPPYLRHSTFLTLQPGMAQRVAGIGRPRPPSSSTEAQH